MESSTSSLAKLDRTTGAIDTTFSPKDANGVDESVLALAVSGNALYVGGLFTKYRGVDAPRNLAKLDRTSVALDPAFRAGIGIDDEAVRTLALDGNGLLVGGDFGYYGGATWVACAARVDGNRSSPSGG